MRKHKGFTLIEVLIVLAVTGLIIALTLVGFNLGQETSRDNTRKELTNQINGMLPQYQEAFGSYPDPSTQFSCTSNAAGCFIVYPNTCQIAGGKALLVNGQCISLNGLNFNNAHAYTSCTFNPPDYRYVTFCFNTSGSSGYTLGTFLESGTTFLATN